MCRTCGKRHNSYQMDPNASGLPEDVSGENAGSIPFSFGVSSPGKMSPLRGCNLKEYEEQLNHLKKENFNLKVRIYYLEDFMGKKCNFKDDKDNLHKANFELKVESEALKKELYDKQELIRQASALFTAQESKYKDQLDQAREQHERDAEDLKARVYHLEKEVEDYAEKCLHEGKDLTQLCGLAFSTGGEEEDFPNNSVFPVQALHSAKSVPLPGMNRSPLQGIFSLPEAEPSATADHPISLRSQGNIVEGASTKIKELERQVECLQRKVSSLEEELREKERTSEALKEDVNNLKKELEDKEEKLADLEVEVAEKDQKVDQLMQDLETRHQEIEAKDSTIRTLHDDLNKVEPEIEIKVQEIIERDRIIEEKIEQLQQQNKILVEIQITLDEKQKQIAELEAKILETQQKNDKLSRDVDISCETIKNLACEMMTRDKEIATLKKELKRKEKKVRDLVAELKESLDMLKKAKWEAETNRGEDGVKEMVEEENERLWAELEQKKLDLMTLDSLKNSALKEAEETIKLLRKNSEEAEARIRTLEYHQLEGSEGINGKTLEVPKEGGSELELATLKEKLESRDNLHKSQQAMIESLKAELSKAREDIVEKKEEVREMKKELFKKNSDVQDFITQELFGRGKEVRGLQEKLYGLNFGKNKQFEDLKLFIESRNHELGPNSREIPNNVPSQVQARCNSLSKLSGGDTSNNSDQKENSANQSGCKSGRSNSFSQLENALYAQMGQKVYNTNQTFNTYVISGEADAKQSTENCPSNLAPGPDAMQMELNVKYENEVKAIVSDELIAGSVKNCGEENMTFQVTPKVMAGEEVEISTMPQAVGTNDSFAIQILYKEVNKLRLETQALRSERENLSEKLSSLQQINDNCLQRNPVKDIEVSTLKKQLEETEEKTLIKDQVHEEIIFDFQDQIKILKGELQEAKKKITIQVLQMASSKYRDSLKIYKQEIISLRKRLVDSHNACDLLRNRLEELVDFFEQIIEMDKNGIINLSHLSSQQRLSLQKTLDDSRALSHSLSHSLMIGHTDSTFGDIDTQNGNDSIFSLPLNELPDEIDLARFDLSMAKGVVPQQRLEETFDLSAYEDHSDFMSQSFAAKITSHVDSRTQEFEAIELKLDHLARVIQEKDDQMKDKNNVIQNLRSGIEKLQNELKLKHQLLLQTELVNFNQCTNLSIDAQPWNHASLSSNEQNETDLSLHVSALQHSVASPNLEYAKGIFHQLSRNFENYSSSETLPPPPPFYSSQEDCKSVDEVRGNHEHEDLSVNTNFNEDDVYHPYSHCHDIKMSSNSSERCNSQIECKTPQRTQLDLEVGLSQEQSLLAPSFALASPSESEAWSEPDRNVSLARIGLDTCTLFTVAHDRSLSRSRLTKSAPFTSESDGEGHLEEVREGSVGQVTPSTKPKRRSDAAEVKRLSSKLKSVEQLNETLRAELHIYQTLHEQLDKRAVSSSKLKKSSYVKPQTSDKCVEADVCMEDQTSLLIPSPLLHEIRSLRLKLEEAIANNDLLRDQLEAALSGYLNEETRCLTQKLAAAQQELKQNQDIINAAETTEHQLRLLCSENESKAFDLSERLAEYMTSSQQLESKILHLMEELKETKEILSKAGNELQIQQKTRQEKEDLIEAKENKVQMMEEEITNLKLHVMKLRKSEKEEESKNKDQVQYIQMIERENAEYKNHLAKHEIINKELSVHISKLDRNSRTSLASDQSENELQDSFQKSQKRLIDTTKELHDCESNLRLITKERFALIVEKTQLEAKLATVVTERDIREGKDHSASAADAQRKIDELQAEKKTLQAEKLAEQKEKQLLREEVSVLKSHIQTREKPSRYSREIKEWTDLQNSYKDIQELHAELLDKYSCLQDKMSSLQEQHNLTEEDKRLLNEEYNILQDKFSSMQSSYDSLQNERYARVAELQLEKCNLQKELEKIRTKLREHEIIRKELTSQLNAERCLTSNLQIQLHNLQSRKDTYKEISESQDLPSPGSAVSVDLNRSGDYSQRHSEAFSTDICSLRATRNPLKCNINVHAQSSSENKENQFPLIRKNLSLPHFTHSATSGESPDLGIGSDGQFSSMEKICVERRTTGFYSHEYAIGDDRNEMLCSIPKHGQMFAEIERLRQEKDDLSHRLSKTKETLRETFEQLANANNRKESVERAICRQLTKTHDVLKKANGNLRQTKAQHVKRSQSDQPEKMS